MADWLVWILGVVLLFIIYRSISFILEFSLLYLFWTLAINDVLAYGAVNAKHYVLGFVAVMALALFILGNRETAKAPPQKVDLILCSYSSNTAHLANLFIEGVEKGGSDAVIHRFHYLNEFNPTLEGDALVVAFPVYGWKPPWPLVDYLWKKLPRGHGKPAFILYTAGGGPENAGLVAWFLLKLKGYRVVGRDWSIYPMNVATFRLGPKGLWRFLDNLSPLKIDAEHVRRVGEEFAWGVKTGLPFVLSPSPLLLIGLLFDNRWINAYIYRNRVWKKRCIKCGLCVKYCPVGRLAMENGFPRARGTCALCFGCINLCPKNAMQMLGWTEYGNPYKPRWPELLVKKE